MFELASLKRKYRYLTALLKCNEPETQNHWCVIQVFFLGIMTRRNSKDVTPTPHLQKHTVKVSVRYKLYDRLRKKRILLACYINMSCTQLPVRSGKNLKKMVTLAILFLEITSFIQYSFIGL